MNRHANGKTLLVSAVRTAPSGILPNLAVSFLLALYDEGLVPDATSEEPLTPFTGRHPVMYPRSLVTTHTTRWEDGFDGGFLADGRHLGLDDVHGGFVVESMSLDNDVSRRC